MRIGSSRADRLGFMVVLALAALLATLLILNPGNSSESTQAVDTTGEISDSSAVLPLAAAPEQIETTEPIPVPDPTPTPETFTTTALPAFDAEEADAQDVDGAMDDDDADAMADDESDADGADEVADDTATETAPDTTETQAPVSEPAAQPATTESAAAAPAATAVPNPQPSQPLPEATEVPNPQPSQPLPEATEVPNPQPSQPVAPIDVPPPAPAGGTFTHTLTATVQGQIPLYSTPGGSTFMPTFNGVALPAQNPTVFGKPLVYRVIAGSPGDAWAQVFVPARPNGTTAWVQTSQFNWGSSNRMIRINAGNNTVTVFDGNNVLLTTAAVTGKSTSRTPIANGWVEEIIPGPSGAYGPLLISLGLFSNDLNSFGGSVPKIALHGTNNPGLMGTFNSNGCIRVPNDIITQIANLVPLGSRVEIVSG